MNTHKTIRIAHLINPFKCNEDNPSYLYYAQPITFKSMYAAKKEAESIGIQVDLYAINFPEDDEIIPDYFIKLPCLRESTKTIFPDISGEKKLPIIQEMLVSIYNNSDAEYIVFTNSDIGVQRNFYVAIYNLIISKSLNSFIINRRDNIPKFKNQIRLTEQHLDIIYEESGVKHPGKDCFIMKRELLKQIDMGNMFTGYPPWGKTLYAILKEIDQSATLFTNLHLTFHLGSDKAWGGTKNKLWEQNIQERNKLGYSSLKIGFSPNHRKKKKVSFVRKSLKLCKKILNRFLQ